MERCQRDRDVAIRAVLALAGLTAGVISHLETPWQAATFDGIMATTLLHFGGMAGVEAGELLIIDLPSHEFAIPGWIAADAIVTFAERHSGPEPALIMGCKLLLVRAA